MKGVKVGLLASISREAPVLIAGPTASGKSRLAMEIAGRDGRVVVNADALQVYGCWRVLSARPTVADEAAVPHALYGHVRPEQLYSVGHWLRDIGPLLDRPVVVVGGSGLNFAALTEGLAGIPAIPADVRAAADDLRRSGKMATMLAGLDEATKARIDQMNPMRVQRAWEVLRATGRGLADWHRDTAPPLLPLGDVEPLVLRPEVAWLNARIDARFDAMLDGGALEEVRALRADWDATLPASRAIGAKELLAHLRGELTLAKAVDAASLATRQYAKRQRTWFRSRMQRWREVVPT